MCLFKVESFFQGNRTPVEYFGEKRGDEAVQAPAKVWLASSGQPYRLYTKLLILPPFLGIYNSTILKITSTYTLQEPFLYQFLEAFNVGFR